MYSRCVAGFVLALFVTSAFTNPPQMDDAKSIQGTWKVVSFTGPSDVPEDIKNSKNMTVKITKDQFALLLDGKDDEKAYVHYRIVPTAKPKEFDLIGGPKKTPITVPGIYELDGDDLKICIHPGTKPRLEIPKDKKEKPDPPVRRPTEFKGSESSVLLILKRVK